MRCDKGQDASKSLRRRKGWAITGKDIEVGNLNCFLYSEELSPSKSENKQKSQWEIKQLKVNYQY
jgi:hypothetical protein